MKTQKMKLETLEEKIEALVGRIVDAGYQNFNDSHTAEEIEELQDLDDFMTYDDEVSSQDLWIKGYENYILADVSDMKEEDILTIYNAIYGKTITMDELIVMQVYRNNNDDVEAEIVNKNGEVESMEL